MTTETSRTPDTLAGGTTHTRLQAWVDEVAALTTPAKVVWVTGSDQEWTRLTDRLVEAGTFTRLNPATKPNSFHARSTPNDVARVEDRTYICSREEKDAGPTNNWMDPEEMKDDDARPVCRAACGAGRCTSSRSSWVTSTPRIRCSASRSPTPSTSSCRCASCPAAASTCCAGWRRRRPNYVPCLHSVGAPLEPGQAGRAVAVQRHEVHRPLPRGADHLVLRLGLRRQRAARQEVLRPAHRERYGSRRGLARRAHAHPQAHLAGAAGLLRRRRLPERLRQDQPRHARTRPSRGGRWRPSATTSPGCGSARTAGCMRSTPSSASSASPPAPTRRPTPTRCAPSRRATRSSPTSR